MHLYRKVLQDKTQIKGDKNEMVNHNDLGSNSNSNICKPVSCVRYAGHRYATNGISNYVANWSNMDGCYKSCAHNGSIWVQGRLSSSASGDNIY